MLLALLPLQLSWAAVTSFCLHQNHGDAHLGHLDRAHHDGNGSDAGPAAEQSADVSSALVDGVGSDKTSAALDLDCGQCHGSCGLMLSCRVGLPGALSNVLPSATLDEVGAAHAPTRPERPQWLRLA